MVQAHSAHALVAGCPAKYTLLQSTPYLDNNFFLYGRSAVVTDAYRSTSGTKASRALSPLLPGPWYAWNQTYVPYNLEGLDGKSIIKEVLHAMPPDYAHPGETDRQYRRRVWKLLVDMHGDQKWYSLRIGSWLLSLIFKWLFNGELFVNLEVCSKLRELAPKSTFVYVPTHKSHLDYHMLSYVLFAEGLACPHIAAGDNLNLPIIGRIMRTCGAFFIRRSIKNCPDAALYKACLDRYLRNLMAHGSPTEFFIEGGRARDGRIAPPKLGLLTSAVQAALTPKGSREGNLYIVPVAISYDFPLEEAGLLRELLGDKKRKETIWQFISAFSKLVAKVTWALVIDGARRPLGCGGSRGRVAVGFGQPICVQKFLKERARRRRKRIGARCTSKPNLLHVSSSEVTFEELLDLARAEDAAQNPQAVTASDTSLNPAVSGSVSSSTDSVVALAEALPPGSDSRRAAVAALGNEIHTRLLRRNCVPSSAVLAAALLPAAVVGKCGEFGEPDNSTTVGPEATNSRKQQQPAKLSSALLIQRYRWVQRQLTAHSVPVMPLPVAPLEIPCCAQSPAFVHDISVACAPHVAITKHKITPPSPQPSTSGATTDSSQSTPQQQPQKQTQVAISSPGRTPRRSARGAAPSKRKPTAPFSVNLQQGAEPVLWQHTRLNMVLPATAPVGLVAAALCAASGGVMPCGAESNGAGAGAVDCACIVSNVLWLRSFLAPDLNAALGMETLTSPQSVQSELSALVNAGAIFRASPQSSQTSSPIIDSSLDLPASLEVASMPSPSNAPLDVFADAANAVAANANGSTGDFHAQMSMHAPHASNPTANGSSAANGLSENGAAAVPLCYCVSESSRKMLAFHAATLAPLIATYAAVLKYACAKLSAGEVMTRAEFSKAALKWLRDAAADNTSAISAVPSQLLVQHAVESLVEEGCLATVDEETASASQDTESPTAPAYRVGNASPQSVLAGLSPVATQPATPPPFASGAQSSGAANSDPLPVAYPISGGLVGPSRGRKVAAEAKGGIAAAKDGSIALHTPATARRALSTLEHALGALEPLQVTLPDV